ncbi:hypothetical protein HDU98_005817, partial [Podochytrium sp. JEL0797]
MEDSNGWASIICAFVMYNPNPDDNQKEIDDLIARTLPKLRINPDAGFSDDKMQCVWRLRQEKFQLALNMTCARTGCRKTWVSGLKRCECCPVVSYCWRECQKQDWAASNKHFCRSSSILKPRDIVMLEKLVARSDLNGQFREVVEFNEEKG